MPFPAVSRIEQRSFHNDERLLRKGCGVAHSLGQELASFASKQKHEIGHDIIRLCIKFILRGQTCEKLTRVMI